jgi:hypothetical protein
MHGTLKPLAAWRTFPTTARPKQPTKEKYHKWIL